MYRRSRQAYEDSCARRIALSRDRLERLRLSSRQVENSHRLDFERALDDLRGRCNSALAKLEAVRRSSDDGWSFTAVHADAAFERLQEGLNRLEAQIPPGAPVPGLPAAG